MVEPRSSVVVYVKGDVPEICERLGEGSMNLLLERQICASRSLVHPRDGCGDVVLTDFRNELQQVPKATVIAYLHEFVLWEHVRTIGIEWRESSDPEDVAGLSHISPDLSPDRKQQLTGQIGDFRERLSTSSKVRQIPVAKNHITVDESTKPIHQNPYHVSNEEWEAIRIQVKACYDKT